MFAQNYSLEFEGEDWVEIPVNNFQIGNEFAFYILYKPDVLENYSWSNNYEHFLFSMSDYSYPNNFNFSLAWSEAESPYTPENSIKFGLKQDNSCVQGAALPFQSSQNIIEREIWQSVFVSNQNSVLKIYINEDLILEEPSPQSINFCPSNFRIGNWWVGDPRWFIGNIKEFKIFNVGIDYNSIYENYDNLVADWNFNEGSGTTLTDLSGNGNHGTIYGATWSTDVPIVGCTDPLATNYNADANFDDGSCTYPDNDDYSLSFDGVDDFVDFGNPENLEFMLANSFTIDLDIYINEEQIYPATIYKRGDGDGQGQNRFISIELTNSNMLVFYLRGDSEPETNSIAQISMPSFNMWHRITVIRNFGENLSIYVDGEFFVLTNDNSGIISNFTENRNHLIGGSYSYYEESVVKYFNGKIDNFKIINKALDESEVNSLYENNDINGIVENYYPFNAGSGDILYDHSGNGNHGTIYGAEWVSNTNLESLTISPQSLDFGEVRLGESAELIVDIGNNGEEVVEVTDITSISDQLSVFPVSFSVYPNGSVPLTITYTPTAEGTFLDTLTIISTDSGDHDFDLPISATAIAEPIINVSTEPLQFDVVVFEDTLTTQTLTIENTGFDMLEVSLCNSGGQGYALEFDGINDKINIPEINDYEFGYGDFTIQFSANLNNNWNGTYQHFLSMPNQETFGIKAEKGSNIIYFIINSENTYGYNNFTYTENTWETITIIRRNEVVEFYSNGVFYEQFLGLNSYINSNEINIGNGWGAEFTNGLLDDIKIWNRALNINEIQSNIYNNDGLVGYWNFNEGEGNIVYDLSGNENHGTIHGATWVESPFSTSIEWLLFSETTLSIPPGESENIEISANGSGYELGDYDGSIQITTNDPENLSMEIPVNMSVLYPIANVEAESINFGETAFNSINNYELQINNDGNYPLDITSSFSVGYSEFDILNDSLTVQPGDTGFVQIQLSTELEEMELADTLILSMNDPSLSIIAVPLSALVVPSVDPIITNIEDVPNDQGGWVRIFFTRSYHDTDSLRNIENYSIEINDGIGWTGVNSINGYGEPSYIALVHTTLDSSSTSDGLIDFRIIAGMEEGNFVSEVVQGYSVDNIVPAEPMGMTLQYGINDNQFSMDWFANQDDDLSHYVITQNNEIIATPNISEFNTELNLEMGVHQFTLKAVDVNGNESNAVEKEIYIIENELSYGNNLISIPGDLENNSSVNFLESIMEMGPNVNFLLGQGVGIFNTAEGWSGNLNNISSQEGYWLNISGSHNLKINPENGALQNCESYTTGYGNNLLSFRWGNGNKPTLDALGGEEFASENFNFILGQGVGLFNTASGWSGNLNDLVEGKGYWVNTSNENLEFRWGFDNCATPPNAPAMAKVESTIPQEYQVNQSTEQAFYLIKEIEEIENGDIITAYCGEQLVGSAIWDGEYTAIPVMGRDISEQTVGFCEPNEVPSFVWKKDQGEGKTELGLALSSSKGEIPGFANLGVYTIEKLESVENEILPTEWSLAPAYPNPFNPVTTIEIGVPEMVETRRPSMNSGQAVSLQIFDINGRLINTLIDGQFEPGFHTIEWDATGFPSGLYFVKMVAGDPSLNSGQGFTKSQKLMLVK